MSELSPEAKRLLSTARESYSPAPARVDAVREALAARIATLGSQGAASSAGALSVTTVAPKLVVIGLIAAAGAGALWFATRGAAPPPPPAIVTASPSTGGIAPAPAAEPIAGPSVIERPPARVDRAEAGTDPHAVRTDTDAAPGAHTPRARTAVVGSTNGIPTRAPDDAAPPAAAPAPRRTHGPAPANSKPLAAVSETPSAPLEEAVQTAEDEPTSVPVDDSLASELALLRRARTALDRNDAKAALSLAKQHATLYPRGTLRQERLATQILALCGLQRPEEARDLVRELERVAPRSPHLMRIRTSCVRQEGSDEVR